MFSCPDYWASCMSLLGVLLMSQTVDRFCFCPVMLVSDIRHFQAEIHVHVLAINRIVLGLAMISYLYTYCYCYVLFQNEQCVQNHLNHSLMCAVMISRS